MTLEQALETPQHLPVEKQAVVARFIELLAEAGETKTRAPIPSWCGILKGHGPAPSFEDCREARRECWSFERKSDPL